MKKIYLIALAFAILTGVAVFNFASYLQNSAKKDMVQVVYAKKSIPENTLISADMLESKSVPAEGVSPAAVKKLQDAVGKVTNARVDENEQLLNSKLSAIGNAAGPLSFNLPDGKRAITVAVDDITGVSGNIKKGNHIDIVATLSMDKGGTKVTQSVLLLQNIAVVETNETVAKDQKSVGYTNITLAVTPQEALKLFYAQTNGSLSAMLRPVLDTNSYDIGGYAPN